VEAVCERDFSTVRLGECCASRHVVRRRPLDDWYGVGDHPLHVAQRRSDLLNRIVDRRPYFTVALARTIPDRTAHR